MHQIQSGWFGRSSAAHIVTGCRFILALTLAVAGLSHAPGALIGALAYAALISDFIDGRLARALGTSSRLGARLDQEADALLILVLSAIVAEDLWWWWVLGIGLAHYFFGALFALVPALRTPPVRTRYWCKVVAAAVGLVLATVAAVPMPGPVAAVAIACVALLLAESFVHEAADRWRAPREGLEVTAPTVVAWGAVWLAMVLPSEGGHVSGAALVRLPVEILIVGALALLPWRRLREGPAVLVGFALGVLALITTLDIGFHLVFGRGFDMVGDWAFLGPGVGVLADSIGSAPARAVAVLAVVAAVAVLVAFPLAVVRLVRAASQHRRTTLAAAVTYALVWGAFAISGSAVASAGAAQLARSEVAQVRATLADRSAFAAQIADDPYAGRAASDPRALLTGLAGKDVLLVFVESYGRVAVQDTSYSTGVGRVLDRGNEVLAAAGYESRSAFLTSPTFGAGSWLAHATLQSGLWVNDERRYAQLLASDRLTLTRLFGEAGWQTVFDVPADTRDWPEGRDYYGFQHSLDSRNVGYRGPTFGYSPVPDQYVLEQFRRSWLRPGHAPVMAEIDLTSSHHPWTPLPRLVPWDRIGDGSIFTTMPQTPTSTEVFAHPEMVQLMYGKSVEYTWQTLISFLTTYPDPDRVLVVVGDHQPHGYVSGTDPGHDVPITVIAQDPDVLDAIGGWGWPSGLRPPPHAPVWRMDAFRDRFLAAYGG